MAVPSSGELSLAGIALEMIHNLYQAHNPLPPGPDQVNNVSLIGPAPNYPQSTGTNGIYSPVYALYAEDTSNYGTPTHKSRTADAEAPFMLSDASDARALADISLGGMSTSTYGFSSGVMAAGSPGPVANGVGPRSSAHSETYEFSSTGLGPTGIDADSTIMYTIFRGGSDGSGNHIIGAYVYTSGTGGVSGGPDKFVFVDPNGDINEPTHPEQESPAANVHPATIGINTANPSANRPDGASTTNQSAMSEWYSYDHDYVAPASPGVHMGSALFSGDGSTTLYTYNIDLSDPDYAGGPVVGAGTTQYLIFAYKNGNNPPASFFRGDVQVTTFSANGTLEPFAPPYPSSPFEKWQTSTQPAINPRDPLPATPANAISVYNFVPSWTTVPGPAGTAGRWNYRTGSTPSGGTAVTDPGGYMYAETSSGNFGRWYIARLLISFTSNDVQLQVYRLGGNIGSLFVGIEIEDACFVMGTLITMYDGTYKPIEEIQVGDIVFTQVGEEEVLKTLSPVHSDIVEYTFSDGTKTKNTSDHPYYVIDKGWCSNSPILTNQRYDIETEEFVCGDVCINDNDEQIELVGIEKLDGDFQTYTFSTDSKTYYANKLLVHSEI